MKTFKKWPLRFMPSKDLAHDGFIYKGKKDLVLCVYCGVIIEQWEEGDVPNIEHQKNSPFCPFVCMLKDIESASGMSIYLFVANIQIYIYIIQIYLFDLANLSLFSESPTLLSLKNG